jgi:hypothetical protein
MARAVPRTARDRPNRRLQRLVSQSLTLSITLCQIAVFGILRSMTVYNALLAVLDYLQFRRKQPR